MAKSIYENILKVKKQKVENARFRLLEAQNGKNALELELQKAKDELNIGLKIKPQNSGDLFMLSNSSKTFLQKEKVLSEKINLAQKEIVHFSHLYKLANIDYEKIKYLYEEDLKALRIQIEKKQALELDEIATMLFANKEN